MKTDLNNRKLYHQSSSLHRCYLSQFKSIPSLPFLNYRMPSLKMGNYFISAHDSVCVDTALMLAKETPGYD